MDTNICDALIESDFMDFNDSCDDFIYGDDGSDLESYYETRTMITAATQSTGVTSRSSDSYCSSQTGESKNSSSASRFTNAEQKENAKLNRARKIMKLLSLEGKAKQVSLTRNEKFTNRLEIITKLKEMKESYKEAVKTTISFLFGGAREYVDPLSLQKFMSPHVTLQLPLEPFWHMNGSSDVTDGRRVISGLSSLQRYRKMYNIKMESISRHGSNIPRFLSFSTNIDKDSFVVTEGKALFSFDMKSKNALLCGGSKEIETNGKCFATFEESTNLLLTLDVHYDAYEHERKLRHVFGPSIYQPLNIAALVPLTQPDGQQLLAIPPLPSEPSGPMREEDAVFCLELKDNQNEAYPSLSFDDMKIVYQNDRFAAMMGSMTESFNDSELHKLLFACRERSGAEGGRDLIQLLSWVPFSVHVGHSSGCTIESSSVAETRLRNAYYTLVPYCDGETLTESDNVYVDRRRAKPNRLMVTITKCTEVADEGVNLILNMNRCFLERTIAKYREMTDMLIRFNETNSIGGRNPMQFIAFMTTAQEMLSHITSSTTRLKDGTINFVGSHESNTDDSSSVVRFIKWMMTVEEDGMKPVSLEQFHEALPVRKRKMEFYSDTIDDAGNTSSSLSKCLSPSDDSSAMDSPSHTQDNVYTFDADLAEVDLLSNPLYNMFVEEKRSIKLLVQDLSVFFSQIRDSNFLLRDIVGILKRPGVEKTVMRNVEKVIYLCWTRHSFVQIQELLKSVSIYVSEKKFDEAITLISQVISLDPTFAEGFNNRATLHFAQSDNENFKAKPFFDDIQAVLRLEPNHYGAMFGNSLMLFRMHQYEETVQQLQVAIATNPSLAASKQVQKILEICDQEINKRGKEILVA